MPHCCHNNDGNAPTKERMANVVDAMKLLGLEGRVHLEWVSASGGHGFVERIRALDHSPLRAG